MAVRPAFFVAFAVSLAACGTPSPSQDAGSANDVAAERVEAPDVAPLDAAPDVAPLDVAATEAGPDCAAGTVFDAGTCAPCPTGYRESAGRCVDVDECAEGSAGCDAAPAGQCANTEGAYTCGCAAGYTGTGVGAGSCRYNDPALSSLAGSSGALSPAFSAATTMYTLTASGPTITLTPAVAAPARATIRVNGAVVASGSASPAISVGVIATPVTIEVTAEGGATRAYTVVVQARSTYVKGANPRSDYQFGGSIALSADGNTLAVGSPVETSPATGINGNSMAIGKDNAGAVFVYTRPAGGGAWTQQAYVKASNTEFFAAFGASVALSADGNTLAVGSPGERSNATGINGDQTNRSALNAGAVYVFTRSGATWSQQAYVKASNAEANDGFGTVLALSADGSTLAVGAMGEDSSATGVGGNQADNGASEAGAVYVFARASTAWSQQAYLKASNASAMDRLGRHLAMSADGDTLAVGSTEEDSNATGVNGDAANNGAMNSGAVYVFTRAAGRWSQQAYLKASNTEAADYFGVVALSGDGNTLAVGAASEASNATGVGGDQANNAAARAGAVYVFTRASSAWSQQAYLKASNAAADDMFGSAVSLASDGSTLAVGASGEDSNATRIGGDQANNSAMSAGAAYLFTRMGSTWSQRSYVKASNSAAGDQFGLCLALSASGGSLAVCAEGEDSNAPGIDGDESNNSATNAGAVYVF